jgi:hypothetical protein
MKAERKRAANTLRGTLLLRMATLDTLANEAAWSSVEGSLPSSRKKVLQLSKNIRSGLQASQGSCPLLTILAIFL